MADVPLPNIKPALVPGGTHRAIYMGSVGASSTPTEGDYAIGVVRLTNSVGSPVEMPPIGLVIHGPDGMDYHSTQHEYDGADLLLLVQANEKGHRYNIGAGVPVTVELRPEDNYYSPNAVVESDFWGGHDEQGPLTQVHIDLQAFSPNIRNSRYFAEQLQVWIQPLDVGITDVQPQVIREEDLHGPAGQPPEYLTLNVTSDMDANQWVVWIMAPHSHHR